MIAKTIDRLEKYLTKGKEYEVLEEDDLFVLIIDNSGQEYWHNKKRFEEKKNETT